MTNAILFIAMSGLYHFTGNVPRPFTEQVWERYGGQQIVKGLDERYLNEELRLHGGNIIVGAQVLFQQKLIFKTEF
jgi:hypothetical protein